MAQLTLNSIDNPNQQWFIFSDRRVLLTNELKFPKGDDLFIKSCAFQNCFSFAHDEVLYVTASLPENITLPTHLLLHDLRDIYRLFPTETVMSVSKARQLLEWDKLHKYCGACGTSTIAATNEYSRTCTNPSCKQIFYPRINPVVIVAVEKDQEILLARSPRFPPNIYSMIAGFVEPGESVEQAVAREVREETGIEIENIRYFASQPWPFPSELILGFQADYKSGIVVKNSSELTDAAFFHVNKLPATFPGNFTISQWLLADFCRRAR